MHAFAGEVHRHRAAEAAGPAGDDGDLSLELFHGFGIGRGWPFESIAT